MRRERMDYKGLPVATLDYPLNVFRYIFGSEAPYISYPLDLLDTRIRNELTPAVYEALKAVFAEGLSIKEASEALGLKECTVRLYLKTAFGRISYACHNLTVFDVPTPKELFNAQVKSAGLGSRLCYALLDAGDLWDYTKTFDQNLLEKSPSDFLGYTDRHGYGNYFGEKSIIELQDYLRSKGYNWGKEFNLLKLEEEKLKLEKKRLQLKKIQLEVEQLEKRIQKMQLELGDVT